MEQRWLDEISTCFVELHSSGYLIGNSCESLITSVNELLKNELSII